MKGVKNATASSASASVFDATVFVRAVVDDHERAQKWLAAAELREVELEVPDLVWLEVGQALRTYVLATQLARFEADEIIAWIARYPANIHPLQRLLPAAWNTAVATGLTVDDACYLALAQAAGATLVTFDTDFVGLYDRLELLA